jgi:hypothetical protein
MPRSAKAKTRISITIIPMVNVMLEKMSERTGASKSALVENALKDYLEKQLETDAKALAKLRFDDLPTDDEWQEIQSEADL